MHSWENLYGLSGETPEQEFIARHFLNALHKMYVLFIKKNHDYGPKNLSASGRRGVAIRLGDKVSRLWTLLGLTKFDNKRKVEDEDSASTWLDTANYGVIGYLMDIGIWEETGIDDIIGDDAMYQYILSKLEHDKVAQQALLDWLVATITFDDFQDKVDILFDDRGISK